MCVCVLCFVNIASYARVGRFTLFEMVEVLGIEMADCGDISETVFVVLRMLRR